MSPQRIQLRRTKGWRKPEGAIAVSRPSVYGNPFSVGTSFVVVNDTPRRTLFPESHPLPVRQVETVVEAISLYRAYVLGDSELLELAGRMLRGHDLACWCPLDQPCHADVLLELANGEAP